jgi:hypothetical protein
VATKGPIVLPQVIFKHGKPWWNDIDMEKLLIYPPQFSDNPTSKVGGNGKGNYEFCLMKYLFHALKGFLTCSNILKHGANDFTSPLKEGVLWIFIALKNPSPSVGSEPANLGSNGKHANNQTPEDYLSS